MRKLGIPPENLQPNRYTGPKANLTPCVEAKRRPSTLDRTHPLLTMWRVDSSPTSGTEGEVWQLVRFETGSGDATWRRIDFSTAGPGIDSFTVDAVTAPGVNPVEADGAGLVTVGASSVANHTTPIETHSRALNEYQIEIQVASDRTGAPANALDAGICSFDDSAFIVDPATGYVTLAGGLGPAIDSLDVDFNTLPGTDPVVPDGAGVVSLYGNVVANATNLNSPVATHSRAVNQSHIDVQLSTAITVPGDPFDVGLASFDSAVFSVDANGWVSLAGGGLAVDSFQVDAIAGTGVNPVVATAGGLVSVGGGVVANADIPLQSISRAPNEYDLEIQVAKAVTGAPGVKTGAGVATFDDTKFSVNSDGYVTSIGSGPGGAGIVYLATATAAASASLDFESLIDGTYNSYLFIFDHILPANLSFLLVRTSSNGGIGGGGSYDSGAGNYGYTAMNGGTPSSSLSSTTIRITTLDNGANEGMSGSMILYTPSDNEYTQMMGQSMRYAPSGIGSYHYWGVRKEAAVVNAIQFYMSSGNITSGTIKMYGMTTPA